MSPPQRVASAYRRLEMAKSLTAAGSGRETSTARFWMVIMDRSLAGGLGVPRGWPASTQRLSAGVGSFGVTPDRSGWGRSGVWSASGRVEMGRDITRTARAGPAQNRLLATFPAQSP